MLSLCDASFQRDYASVQGEIILLANRHNSDVSPLLWKTKSILRVCKSSKDAETRAADSCAVKSVYAAQVAEFLLWGDIASRMKVHLYTDSKPLIESIGSTKRIDNKGLWNVIEYLKEVILHRKVELIGYVNTLENPADILTKYKAESDLF